MVSPSTQSSPVLPVWKKVLFALIPAVLLFGLAESILALVGVEPRSRTEDPFVGFSRSMPLFVPDTEGTTLVTAQNKRGFFNLQRFAREKPPGAFRIFTLGGSTTYGRPYADATSFSGWLRELLPLAEPSRKWEVINAGGISYASYRVANLVDELADYDPDLFVIYTGHNEYLEERTYGGVRDMPAALKGSISLLSRTRIWAALSTMLKGRAKPETENDGRAMLPEEATALLDHSAGPERYERDDELAAGILTHYRYSLERMIDTARGVGAEVILVVPASNLRDCSPFKSQPTDGLSPEQLSEIERLDAEVAEAIASGRHSDALATIDRALAIDPRSAGLHFLRGRTLLQLGDPAAATVSFERAREEDVCPLRALTGMQQAVREVGERRDVPVVDYPALLEDASREGGGNGIPGEDLFLDHVHPTIASHRMLAVALIRQMRDSALLDRDAQLDDDAIAAVAQSVEATITPELHARALGNLSLTLDWAGKKEESRRLAERALETGVEDPTILMMVARHAAQRGQGEEALGYFRRALRANPGNPVIHSQIGLLLTGRRQLEAAAAHLFLARLLWQDNESYRRQLDFVMQQRRREAPGAEIGEVATTRYASGYPRTIAQTIPGPDGSPVFHGIWTEWHDGGALKGFADYRSGRLDGFVVRWDEQGREVERRPRPGDEP